MLTLIHRPPTTTQRDMWCCMEAHTHTHTQRYTPAHCKRRTHTHTHRYTPAHCRRDTHTHTYAHTFNYMLPPFLLSLFLSFPYLWLRGLRITASVSSLKRKMGTHLLSRMHEPVSFSTVCVFFSSPSFLPSSPLFFIFSSPSHGLISPQEPSSVCPFCSDSLCRVPSKSVHCRHEAIAVMGWGTTMTIFTTPRRGCSQGRFWKCFISI